jgi:hypothetical protein
MASPALPALKPEELLGDLLGLDPGLRREAYYGERSIFYNPGGVAPLGSIFASVKDRDGPNDKAARLSRQGVDLTGYDLTRLGELTPHPVDAWMRWVQILSRSRSHYESLEAVKVKLTQRTAG